MAYNTQPLLTDANGKPIPQYYDPVADAFKPIEGEGGANKTQLTGSKVKPVKTHNAVIVTAGSVSYSSWIDCDGFNNLEVILANDAATSSEIWVQWSTDGSSLEGQTLGVKPSDTKKYDSGGTSVKARYARIALENEDTADHTMNTNTYLRV